MVLSTNRFMSRFKKGLATILSITILVWSLGLLALNVSVAQAAAGDLVKSADSGTVYVVLADGESICSLTSEGHYDMWAKYKAEGVGRWQDVSTVDTSAYTDAGVCSLRVGSLVRTESNPEVFVIQSDGTKRGFDAWETFQDLGYGSGGVYFVGQKALDAYTTGDKITSETEGTEIREGQLVKYADSATVYYIDSSDGSLVKREVTNEDAYFANFGINWNLVITIPDTETYTTSESQITGADTSINRPVAVKEGTTEEPVAGGLTVSLSGDTPASTTLVAGQAVADLVHFTFTASSEADLKVTKVKMQRIGVSADATLSAVYLYEGNERISDSATVSSTYITVNDATGLFTVPAGESKTISVKSNIASGTSGETVGVQIVAAADITTASGATINGTFPVKGNLHSIASATLAGVALAATTLPATNSDVQPGETDFQVWKSTATVTTRDVELNYIRFREIGSIGKDDLQNFELYVNGAKVGETVELMDSDYYITFDLTDSPVTMQTGNRDIEVKADVINGSNKNYTLSIWQAADIVVVDSQYGANVTATRTTNGFPATSDTQTIATGSITVTKAADSPSGNVVKNASNVTLGVFTFTAYGEDVKIETLRVQVDVGNVGSAADSVDELRNGSIWADGVQVGSTADLAEADADPSYTSYSLGSSLIVSPGSPVTVEIKADIYDSDGVDNLVATDTIQVKIVGGNLNNGQAQSSLTILDVPSATKPANTVTVVTGSLSGAKDYAYGNQTTIAGENVYKIGDYVVSAAEGEDVNISTFTVAVTVTDKVTTLATNTAANTLSNLYIKYGDNETTPKSAASTSNPFSVSHTMKNNTQMAVEVYADITNAIDVTDTIATTLAISGTTANSGSSANLSAVPGQTITIDSGSVTAAVDATTPVTKIAIAESSDVKVATYKFTTTNAPVTIKDITIKLVTAASDRSVQYAKLDIDNDGTADTPAVSFVRSNDEPYAAFTGLNFEVSKDDTQKVSVLLTLNDVTINGTSGDDVKVNLSSYKYSIAGSETTTTPSSLNGNSVYVFNTQPTVSKLSTSGSLLNGTEMDIYEFSVSADANEDIALKQMKFAININDNEGTDNALTLGNFKLYRGSSDLTDNVVITMASTTSIESGGSSLGEGSSTVVVRWSTEEVIEAGTSSSYKLKATPSGFTTSADDDYFTVQMSGDTSATPLTNGYTYLVDSDTDTSEIIVALGDSSEGNATAANFIWSDNSANAHDYQVDDENDSNTTVNSTGDWFSGYLIKDDLSAAAVQYVY